LPFCLKKTQKIKRCQRAKIMEKEPLCGKIISVEYFT
jgi:hypothetical protein